MQVSCPNNVKIYNLSVGKSLPEVRLISYSSKTFLKLYLNVYAMSIYLISFC